MPMDNSDFGLAVDRPSATIWNKGLIYVSTDSQAVEISDGSGWVAMGGGGGGGNPTISFSAAIPGNGATSFSPICNSGPGCGSAFAVVSDLNSIVVATNPSAIDDMKFLVNVNTSKVFATNYSGGSPIPAGSKIFRNTQAYIDNFSTLLDLNGDPLSEGTYDATIMNTFVDGIAFESRFVSGIVTVPPLGSIDIHIQDQIVMTGPSSHSLDFHVNYLQLDISGGLGSVNILGFAA